MGCAYVDTIEVFQPTVISPSLTVKDSVLCYGDSTGALSVLQVALPGYSYKWNNGDTSVSITRLKAGNYLVTVSDTNSCTYTGVIALTQPDSLQVNLSLTDESKTGTKDGRAFTTVSGGIKPYNYDWSDGSSSFQASNLSAGSFSVVITDNNGCKQHVEFTINDLSVGIDVHNNQRAYRVYPNPTNGELILEFYNSEIISLNVRDVIGKELWNIDLELGQEKTILDLQQLNSGLYFLHLLGQDKNYIVPVVKQ